MWVFDFGETETLSSSLEHCIDKIEVKSICVCLPEENLFCKNSTTAIVKFCSSFADKIAKIQTNKMASDDVSLKLLLKSVKTILIYFVFQFFFLILLNLLTTGSSCRNIGIRYSF